MTNIYQHTTRNFFASCKGCKPLAFAKQAGFSLIELMIALVISLIILAALSSLFLNITRANTEMAKTNMQIENGRFAMQILQSDLVHAGFWGNYIPDFDNLTLTTIPSDTPTAVPAICTSYNTTNWNASYKKNLLGIPIQVYNDAVSTGCASIANKKPNTDILVVRHANICVAGESNCGADITGKLYFQASDCVAPLPANQTPDTALYLLTETGFGSLRKKNCLTAVSNKREFISNIYYIRDYANTLGDGIPTLVRSKFDLNSGVLSHQPAEALIEGIEGFAIQLGIDDKSDTGAAVDYSQAVTWANKSNLTSPVNRGDGNPDGTFVTCTSATPCTAAQLSNVVAVKLFILARTLEPSQGFIDTKTYTLGNTTFAPFNDKFKRHVFSTTVRLVNISTRRETP